MISGDDTRPANEIIRLFRSATEVGRVAGVRESRVVGDLAPLVKLQKGTVHRLHLVLASGLHLV